MHKAAAGRQLSRGGDTFNESYETRILVGIGVAASTHLHMLRPHTRPPTHLPT